MTYQRCWHLVGALVAALILGPALFFWSPSAVVAVFIFAVLFSASVVSVLVAPTYGSTGPHGPGLGRVLRFALVVGVITVAAVALAQLSFGGAIILVVLAVASSPGSVRRVSGYLQSRGPSTHPAPEEPAPTIAVHSQPAATDLTAMSNARLCDTWRCSLLTLYAARDVRARMTAVRFREACLDELERRDPEGVRAWLDSGPSGSPDRFLGRARHESEGDEPPAEPNAA